LKILGCKHFADVDEQSGDVGVFGTVGIPKIWEKRKIYFVGFLFEGRGSRPVLCWSVLEKKNLGQGRMTLLGGPEVTSERYERGNPVGIEPIVQTL
jgi:hypothetical protein